MDNKVHIDDNRIRQAKEIRNQSGVLDRNNKTLDIEKGSMSRYGLELAAGVPVYEGMDQ